MANDFIEIVETESDKVANEFVNNLTPEQLENLDKKYKSKKSKKLNIVDIAVITSTYGAVRTVDFVVDDIIGGGLARKAKTKIKNIKSKKHFKKFGWRNASKEEAENAVTAESFSEVPAVIEVNTNDLTYPDSTNHVVQFTVQEDVVNKVINNNMLNDLIKKYNYSDKLLVTAILWCCGKISDAQVGAVISNAELEGGTYEKLAYLNSITLFFIDKRFAANPNIPDIEFNITPSSLESVVRELSTLDILKDNKVLSTIINKTREYITEKSNKTIIVFDNSKLDLNVSNCPKELVSKIEGEFGDLLAGYKHYINKLPNGLVEVIVIKSDTKGARYIVDPGVINTGEYKWMVPSINDIEYFTSDKEIIKKVIDCDYIISPEEALQMLINEHQFLKQDLAINYDFTLINSKMKNLDRDELMLLEAKLNFIRAEVFDRFKVSARMKVKNFKSLDSFVITSGSTISSPLDEMTKDYVDGLTIKCKGDKYIIELRDVNGNLTKTDTVEMPDELVKLMLVDNASLQTIKKMKSGIKVQDAVYNK